MRAGELSVRLTLENPTSTTVNGVYAPTWLPLSPSPVRAAIAPAAANDIERPIANSVESKASHLITIRYHAGVTTQTRLTKGPRNVDGSLAAGSEEFFVTGLQNPKYRNRELVLACRQSVP